MQIALTERFQKDVGSLETTERATVFEVILGIPKIIGAVHQHAGLGLRKIHPTGIWEVRVGLGLRLVFALASNTLTLVRVGNHDEVRRYLKSL